MFTLWCNDVVWRTVEQRQNAKNPTFSLCCMQGQVQLPLLKEPPNVLKRLMEGDDSESKHFQKNMRPYNMIFFIYFTWWESREICSKGKRTTNVGSTR